MGLYNYMEVFIIGRTYPAKDQNQIKGARAGIELLKIRHVERVQFLLY